MEAGKKKEKEIKCFRYWGVEYYKWKCPNIVAVMRSQKGISFWYT